MNDAYAPAVLGETALLTGGERSASAPSAVSVWPSYRGDLARLGDLSPRMLRDLAGLEVLLYGTGPAGY